MSHFPSSDTSETKIVVHGASGLVAVWPGESAEPMLVRRAREVGSPNAVLGLLATVEGVDVDHYGRLHGADTGSLRSLAAHCEAAVLQAALRVQGELTPATVLDVLHRDALRHRTNERELVALLAS